VSLKQKPPSPPPPGDIILGTHFYRSLSRPQGQSAAGRTKVTEKVGLEMEKRPKKLIKLVF